MDQKFDLPEASLLDEFSNSPLSASEVKLEPRENSPSPTPSPAPAPAPASYLAKSNALVPRAFDKGNISHRLATDKKLSNKFKILEYALVAWFKNQPTNQIMTNELLFFKARELAQGMQVDDIPMEWLENFKKRHQDIGVAQLLRDEHGQEMLVTKSDKGSKRLQFMSHKQLSKRFKQDDYDLDDSDGGSGDDASDSEWRPSKADRVKATQKRNPTRTEKSPAAKRHERPETVNIWQEKFVYGAYVDNHGKCTLVKVPATMTLKQCHVTLSRSNFARLVKKWCRPHAAMVLDNRSRSCHGDEYDSDDSTAGGATKLHVKSEPSMDGELPQAKEEPVLPNGLLLYKGTRTSQNGVFTTQKFDQGNSFGPFEGRFYSSIAELRDTRMCYKVISQGSLQHIVDGKVEADGNWMKYVRVTTKDTANMEAFQCIDHIFFRTTIDIAPNTELLLRYDSKTMFPSCLPPDQRLAVESKEDITSNLTCDVQDDTDPPTPEAPVARDVSAVSSRLPNMSVWVPSAERSDSLVSPSNRSSSATPRGGDRQPRVATATKSFTDTEPRLPITQPSTRAQINVQPSTHTESSASHAVGSHTDSEDHETTHSSDSALVKDTAHCAIEDVRLLKTGDKRQCDKIGKT